MKVLITFNESCHAEFISASQLVVVRETFGQVQSDMMKGGLQ